MDVSQVVSDISSAVEEVGVRHGILIAVGRPRAAGERRLSVRLTVEEVAPEPERTEWDRRAERLGLRREWLGRRFRYRERGYEVVGLLPPERLPGSSCGGTTGWSPGRGSRP